MNSEEVYCKTQVLLLQYIYERKDGNLMKDGHLINKEDIKENIK